MAKKKTTHQSEGVPTQPQKQQSNALMDDAAEKLQSLKSLNDYLVKQVHERRMELNSVVQAKKALEIDLALSMNEKEKLVGELTDANDVIFALELESNVASTFLHAHLDEMGVKIYGFVESEIGLMKDEEIEKWKVQCEKLMFEKKEDEIEKETLLKEKVYDKRMLNDSVVVIDNLKSKIDQITTEKIEIQKEKGVLEMKIESLENEVTQLNESALCFKKEKMKSAEKISDLEKIIEEAMEKDTALKMEIGVLITKLQELGNGIEMLTQKRDSLQRNLNLVEEDSKDLRHKIEIITQGRIDIEKAKMEAEGIIDELQKELSKLRDAMVALNESIGVEKAKNEELVSEVSHFRDALDKVEPERGEAQKSFNDEKKRVENLSLLLSDKEKNIKESMDELKKLKVALEDSLNMKKEIEKQNEILMKERNLMEQSLLESHSKIDEFRAEVAKVVANANNALALLKDTSLVVCDNYEKGELETFEDKHIEEIEPFVEQVNAIKATFINKDKLVEEMKQQLEIARAKEQKKSFFAMVTAATTLFAAVSAIYVNRGG